jgi:arsenate reductase (thioredoxin)
VDMVKVLFVCVHNSARSQMAEAFLNVLGEGFFISESAGLEKGTLNPYVIKVMQEIGYDLSQNQTKDVFDFFKQGKTYSYVIKVCDAINGQRCPIFPGALKDIYWNITDPASILGSEEEILAHVRRIRDEIKSRVVEFISDNKAFALERLT